MWYSSIVIPEVRGHRATTVVVHVATPESSVVAEVSPETSDKDDIVGPPERYSTGEAKTPKPKTQSGECFRASEETREKLLRKLPQTSQDTRYKVYVNTIQHTFIEHL